MKAYYKDHYATVYHADNAEALLELGGMQVIITDPPYPEDDRFEADFDTLHHAAAILHTIAAENAWLVTDCFRPNLPKWIETFAVGWRYYDIIAQFTANSMAQCGFGYDRLAPSIVLKKGNPKINHRGGNVINVTRLGKASDPDWCAHPTRKKVRYLEALVKMFGTESDTILDPWMGSGTTLLAAKQHQRHAIGIEREEKYCEQAAIRLSQEMTLVPHISGICERDNTAASLAARAASKEKK